MALINILARLGIDTTAYNAGLKKSESTAQATGRMIRSYLAGAFTVGAVTKLASDIANLSGKIKDSAAQFNLTTDETQKMMRAAKDSSVSFEMLAQGVNKVTRQRAMAISGDKNAIASFEALGVSMSDIANEGVRSADIFFQIGRNLKGADLRTQGAAIKILGDESSKLFGVMESLGDSGPMLLIEESQIEAVDRAAKAVTHIKDELMNLATIGVGGAIMQRATEASAAAMIAARAARAVGADSVAGKLEDFALSAGKTAMGITPEKTPQSGSAPPPAPTPTEASKVAAGFSPDVSDPLAKIGGLFFGADAGMRAIPQRQLDELRRLNARVERIERAATAD